VPKNKIPRTRGRLFLAVADTLILSACIAVGALLVPALAGPGLPPRAAAFIVLGCFIGGLALCLAVNRRLLRRYQSDTLFEKVDKEARKPGKEMIKKVKK